MTEPEEDSCGGNDIGGLYISRQRSTLSLHCGAPVGKGAGVNHLGFLFLTPIDFGPKEAQQQVRGTRPD